MASENTDARMRERRIVHNRAAAQYGPIVFLYRAAAMTILLIYTLLRRRGWL